MNCSGIYAGDYNLSTLQFNNPISIIFAAQKKFNNDLLYKSATPNEDAQLTSCPAQKKIKYV